MGTVFGIAMRQFNFGFFTTFAKQSVLVSGQFHHINNAIGTNAVQIVQPIHSVTWNRASCSLNTNNNNHKKNTHTHRIVLWIIEIAKQNTHHEVHHEYDWNEYNFNRKSTYRMNTGKCASNGCIHPAQTMATSTIVCIQNANKSHGKNKERIFFRKHLTNKEMKNENQAQFT